MNERIPVATRPLKTLLVAIGEFIADNPEYYNITKDRFVSIIMLKCNGSVNPKNIEEYYYKLLLDARLGEPYGDEL